MAQYLNRRADRQHRCTPARRPLQTRMAKQMFCGKALGVILGTAEGIEVQ